MRDGTAINTASDDGDIVCRAVQFRKFLSHLCAPGRVYLIIARFQDAPEHITDRSTRGRIANQVERAALSAGQRPSALLYFPSFADT
jgi:hypothetical protein